jgi:hypothetical protein
MRWPWLIVLLLVLIPTITEGADHAEITVTAKPPSVLPSVEAQNETDITATSVILHATVSAGGENVTCRGFEWGPAAGNYTWSWNETGTFAEGQFQHQVTNLTYCTEYFWRAFAVNDVGQANSTERNFSTSCIPSAPLNFRVTQASPNSVNLTWEKGIGAETTVIKCSESGYPGTIDDGYLVYNGTGTSAVVENLLLPSVAYYFRAWSQNPYGTSLDYAEGSIGSSPMLAMLSWLQSLVEGPTGIVNIMFTIGLMVFALWKKGWIRIILALSLTIWGAFMIGYDPKIGAPFIAVGAFLIASGIIQLSAGSGEAR